MPPKNQSNSKVQKIKSKLKSKSKLTSKSTLKSKPKHGSSSLSKSKSKSTKMKLDKLNADITEFNEVTQLLEQTSKKEGTSTSTTKDSVKSLKSIKEDYVKDEETKQKNQAANEEMKKQMKLLSDIGL
ncbi:hypothetical protein FOB58_000620 [Candida parapsilosis]|uniref:Uncharacterized protein n=2 Tax=Candida parapsilosis TaxID=5480 RepID=G8BD07_CANPC|nr:uncharacterized protein CPAR2_207950 [Candida parapsilosis]KAF6054698.1 hypothetical protein FOB58_000620 [Candida parapsilosis]KAF6056276.1 hypothetical protein FOB59_000788 [Candida parapsilosis]KAF6059209.1 hypothetical protein FOB60_000791 [Candida parapsilosis]KAF6067966.1 hypothetical protein FOB61_000791 [Candida parapsilosis]KAI5905484.1 hypothetical protein K4G60_g4744 [Candida parapsilosis]